MHIDITYLKFKCVHQMRYSLCRIPINIGAVPYALIYESYFTSDVSFFWPLEISHLKSNNKPTFVQRELSVFIPTKKLLVHILPLVEKLFYRLKSTLNILPADAICKLMYNLSTKLTESWKCLIMPVDTWSADVFHLYFFSCYLSWLSNEVDWL